MKSDGKADEYLKLAPQRVTSALCTTILDIPKEGGGLLTVNIMPPTSPGTKNLEGMVVGSNRYKGRCWMVAGLRVEDIRPKEAIDVEGRSSVR